MINHYIKYSLFRFIYYLSRKYHIIKQRFYISYNRFLFSNKGITYGNNLLVYNHVFVRVDKDAKAEIGNNFNLVSSGGFNPLGRNIESSIYVNHRGTLVIGDNVGISNSVLWAQNCIKIGDCVQIGADSIIIDTNAHSLNWEIRMRGGKTPEGYWIDEENAASGQIVIGNNVLIGTRCIILKGVTIGARSVIGAGSVVTTSIPPDCIAAGNPCRIIKFLKSQDEHSTCL